MSSSMGIESPHWRPPAQSLRGGSIHAASPRRRGNQSPKPLTFLPLVALIFFDVSGGPFGTEDAVNSGSPLLALLGFLILPLAWSVPEALVTAELATAFPENSGFVAWVTAAFGPFAGWMEGWFKWLSGVTDNAIYPVIFLTYLQHHVPSIQAGAPRLVCLLVMNVLLTYLNYRGLHVVGKTAVAMTVFTLIPFFLFCIFGASHVVPSNWLVVNFDQVEWLPFMNVMFWCLNYWDSVSTVAGEVADPSRTFPMAMAASILLVVLVYFFPLLIGIGVDSRSKEWTLGYFADIAHQVGGEWLSWWLVAAAAVSQLGQFEAEMTTDSYQLLGMAERGFLPLAFARRSKYGSPTLAIMLSSLGVCFIAIFNFVEIVELLNAVYCLAEILEFFAFLQLRRKFPSLHRPFAIPLGFSGCVALLTPALLLLALILLLPVLQGNWAVIYFTSAAIIVGALMYPVMQYARSNEWFHFDSNTPDDFQKMILNGIESSSHSRMEAFEVPGELLEPEPPNFESSPLMARTDG